MNMCERTCVYAYIHMLHIYITCLNTKQCIVSTQTSLSTFYQYMCMQRRLVLISSTNSLFINAYHLEHF